jgi:hypothetical protein
MNEKSDGMIKAALKRGRLAALFAAAAVAIAAAAWTQACTQAWAQGLAPPPPPPGANPPLSSNPPPGSNPVCVRLESQLTSLDQGATDPARADQIKRSEDAIAKQQSDLDRAVAQAHKAGCAGEGFFAFFSALSPQCGPITSQIQQMRGNLDRMMSELEQLKTGDTGQQAQRRALIGQLAQNNCGAQYTAAANSVSGPQSFFDALFGGGTIVNPGGDGAPSGTYHTVCVRACDGYYFPISYSTVPSRFADDERACQRQCPASQAELYSFHNPGEDMDQAVSVSGQAYTALPNAFRYRKEVVAGCSCRAAGQSWADALKNADDATTLESGDIIVNDHNAKMLSQPPGKPAAISAAVKPAALTSMPTTPAATDTTGPAKPVRVVGPPFLSRSALQAESASQSQSESQPEPVSH